MLDEPPKPPREGEIRWIRDGEAYPIGDPRNDGFIKRMIYKLRHKHEYKFVRNVYGDEINAIFSDIKRSVWQCEYCGKIKYENHLHNEEE